MPVKVGLENGVEGQSLEVFIIDDQFELAQDGYEVSAWFLHDRKPLSPEEIEHGLRLLEWSRQDLLEVIKGLLRRAVWHERDHRAHICGLRTS